MTTTQASDRFTALPDDATLTATVVALEEHGFSVEVVDDLDGARAAVLARIPRGSTVMTNTSVTLQETGIADAINDGGPYESARQKMLALDFATQVQEMKAIGGQPDYAVGSVHAVTRDGTLVIASASGSQLASYAWGAANVIFVVGAQKLVPTLEAAHERIYQHSLKLEDARAYVAYGQNSRVGKILEIHQEDPGRIHVVLIRQPVASKPAGARGRGKGLAGTRPAVSLRAEIRLNVGRCWSSRNGPRPM
jgi:acyl-CoA hydrolase